MSFPKRMIDGYAAFTAGRLQAEQHRYRELAEHGQTPEIMVIGCCDSRVSPEVIFDAGPGELFVLDRRTGKPMWPLDVLVKTTFQPQNRQPFPF